MASMNEIGAGATPASPSKAKHNVQKPRYTEPPARKLSCVIERNYGTVKISFGVEAEYAPENESDQQRYWLLLEKQVNEMHDEWALNRLPKIKPAPGDKLPEVEEYTALELVLSDRGAWKIRTVEPQYQMYGVAVPKDLQPQADKLLATSDGNRNYTNVKIAVQRLERGAVVTRIWRIE